MDRCANCGAPLLMASDKRKYYCEYCESVFSAEDGQTVNSQDIANDDCIAIRMLDISAVYKLENTHNCDSFKEMCARLNTGETVESCIEELRARSTKHSDWAMEGVNVNLLIKLRKRLEKYMPQTERILFYKDSGLIASAKEGVAITTDNIYIFKKSNVKKIPVSHIRSFHMKEAVFNQGSWFFNSNEELEIDNMACSPTEHGIIMAMICLMTVRCHGDGYRIRVYNA